MCVGHVSHRAKGQIDVSEEWRCLWDFLRVMMVLRGARMRILVPYLDYKQGVLFQEHLLTSRQR